MYPTQSCLSSVCATPTRLTRLSSLQRSHSHSEPYTHSLARSLIVTTRRQRGTLMPSDQDDDVGGRGGARTTTTATTKSQARTEFVWTDGPMEQHHTNKHRTSIISTEVLLILPFECAPRYSCNRCLADCIG